MILVTGGAGFIGSNLVAALAERQPGEVMVCDRLGSDDRWRNLAKHEIAGVVPPADLLAWLNRNPRPQAIVHLGAVSSTTEPDVELIYRSNFHASMELWSWCARHAVRLIYASSAATYGDGAQGFDDDGSIAGLAKLRPLNAYGWSKHLFDRRVVRLAETGDRQPPQCVGLKFFNVYGPNEYHKGDMQSVVAKRYADAAAGREVTLFKSDRPDVPDGGQSRDFVYVRDAVDVMLWLLDTPDVNGLFNVGSGQARSFADLMGTLFAAVGRNANIRYVDMPDNLRGKYQYFTQAPLARLRAAGYSRPMTSLEDGVGDYVRRHLAADPYSVSLDSRALSPSFGARLRWWLGRLASMSGPELAHRLRERARRAASRRAMPDLGTWVRADPAPSVLPRLPDGVGRVAQEPGVLERWQAIADRAADGGFAALGVTWPLATRKPGAAFALPDWQLDPVTGQRWPAEAYCFDVLRAPTQGRDPRHAWEFARLQYLQPIAALAAVSEDPRQVALCAAHIQDWIDRNPPARGLHWASGQELALRAVSLIVVSTLIGERFDAGLRRQILLSLAQHGFWLARFPSLFSNADQRLVAEAGGLYLIGSLAPTLRLAPRWANLGREILEHEVMAQLHADGVGAAQSPAVTAYLLDWFMLCGHVGLCLGRPFSDAYWQRLTLAGEHLRALIDGGGNSPAIGDDGEDRVLYDAAPGGEIAGVLGALAVAVARPALAPPNIAPHLRHALFGVPIGAPQRAAVRHFPVGGYTIARGNDQDIESLVVVDHGPVGSGAGAAQGHADTLSIWLHLAGRPVLIDAGTHAIQGDPVWRAHFRGTPAHNTLSINGEDSSIPAGPLAWFDTPRCAVTSHDPSPEHWSVEAEHDGFVANYGYRHRRRVERGGPGLILITDQLLGNGGVERVEVGFLVAPDLTIVSAAGGWVIGDGRSRLLYIRHEGPLKGWVERGIETTKRGWHSPAFGRRVPAPRLVFAGKMWHGVTAKFTLAIGF